MNNRIFFLITFLIIGCAQNEVTEDETLVDTRLDSNIDTLSRFDEDLGLKFTEVYRDNELAEVAVFNSGDTIKKIEYYSAGKIDSIIDFKTSGKINSITTICYIGKLPSTNTYRYFSDEGIIVDTISFYYVISNPKRVLAQHENYELEFELHLNQDYDLLYVFEENDTAIERQFFREYPKVEKVKKNLLGLKLNTEELGNRKLRFRINCCKIGPKFADVVPMTGIYYYEVR